MDFSVYYGEEEKNISITLKNGKYIADDGKKNAVFDAIFVDDKTLSIMNEGESILAKIINDGSRKVVLINGQEYIFEEEKKTSEKFQTEEEPGVIENVIKSPMPGSVVKLNVKEGDEVNSGDILIIVEAMKMENELRASTNMRVKKVFVKEGDQVKGFVPLIELE